MAKETLPRIMYELKEPATIGDLKCDVVMEREVKFESEVTEHPVEDGFAIADHVSRKPVKLSLTAIFTPTPVTWFEVMGGNNQHRMADVVNALQSIYKKGEPITIKTVDAIYKNMIMTSAPLPRNIYNGYCYSCQLEFVEVRRAEHKTEKIPEKNASDEAKGKAGQTEKDAGQASQDEIGTGITTVENNAVEEVEELSSFNNTASIKADKSKFDLNTSSIDKGETGEIKTGKEQTARIAAETLFEAFGINTASRILNKIAG